MHKSALFLAIAGGVLAATGSFVACSGGGGATGSVDAGRDTGSGLTVFDTSTSDTHASGHDAGTADAGASHDAGSHDAGHKGDAKPSDAGEVKQGMCTLITGACDLVAQNCEAGNECDIVGAPDGSATLACEPVQATEHLPKGAACCPGESNPCDPGLECNGGTLCGDAGAPGPGLPPGWGGSRCTPRCCPSDGGPNTANCGTAGDGGAQGVCNLGISLAQGGPAEYAVCTYPSGCEVLHPAECLSGFGCEVTSASGAASCSVIYNPEGDAGAGATQGQACMYENQCADGLVCVGASAGSTTCEWMCLVAGSPAPFDAGPLATVPGGGGCPSGTSCNGINGFPAWLGSCVPN